MVSGQHTSVTVVPRSQQSSRGFLTLWIFFFPVQLLNPGFCFVRDGSFTVNYSLAGPEIGSLERIASQP